GGGGGGGIRRRLRRYGRGGEEGGKGSPHSSSDGSDPSLGIDADTAADSGPTTAAAAAAAAAAAFGGGGGGDGGGLDSLDLSVRWEGIVLQNVELRRDFLADLLGLPVDVPHAFVRRAVLHLPWYTLMLG
ncbi:unnamed protein product, partial [Laminaria digitata]